MSLQRISFATREEWLKGRGSGIGASEAASAIGRSKFQTNLDLFNLKTGKVAPKDLSDNPNVGFGQKAEEHIRSIFALEHPNYKVEYHAYDILFQDERPWLRATLDGELTDDGGRKGILEIKTAECKSKLSFSEWNDRLPEHYFIQTLHQMAATGWDFVILVAKIRKLSGDSEIRHYKLDRTDYQADIDYLVEKESIFWNEHVMKGIAPNVALPEL